MRRILTGALALSLMGYVTAAPADATILFAKGSDVPRPVQEFAWCVIETRCNFRPRELAQRSLWAHDARGRRVDAGVVYSIRILSDLSWKKTEPPVIIEMTLVDDGEVRLIALKAPLSACGL